MKKIITIVGARPQFIKAGALSPVLRKHFKEILIHTGQHYDLELSDNFFTELSIPKPDYNLNVGSDSASRQIAQMMIKLDEILDIEKPDLIIVFGDTNSTAAGAICAAKHQIKLAHVEAGLREFNKAIPEESNKLITDALSDFYFCPTDTGVKILNDFNIYEHVYNVGDVMIDLNYRFDSQIKANNEILKKYGLKSGEFALLTCHRASNTDNIENLKSILSAIGEIKIPVIFPLHPRTKAVIEKNGLNGMLEAEHIKVSKPLGYLDTQSLIQKARFVMTDSGGVTKEAYYYRTPGIIIDKQTEWIETVNEGWNIITGPNKEKILDGVNGRPLPKIHSNCLGNGKASEKIADVLLKYL
jgi:UDP-GlcNAc3NAcA epimerase